MKNMRKSFLLFSIIFVSLVASIIFFLTPSPFVTAAPNDTVTVDVQVQAISEITVSPTSLSWNVNPGDVGGIKLLDIKNTGSLNVSNIHGYVDTIEDENSRPYGSDNATDYAVGGVIVLKNETYDKFFNAGRLEWNSTEDVSNKDLSDLSPSDRGNMSWGFFRNTSYEYFWALGNGTDGNCNSSSGVSFAIEDDVDNGTAESRTPTISSIVYDGGGEDWGYFSVSRATAPIYESCVATYYDCSKIYIYKYDKRTGYTDCSNSRYVQEINLPPSNIHTMTLDTYVPLGIPDGSLNTSTLTIIGS